MGTRQISALPSTLPYGEKIFTDTSGTSVALSPPPISSPGVGGPAYDKDGAVTHVRNYGAIPDGVVLTDAAITSGLAILTSPGNKFVGAVAGMAIGVEGAGAAGVTLVTTILSVQSLGQVTL